MQQPPPFTSIVQNLPATVPFVAPEALERQSGRSIKVRLGANESAFGISPRAREAMRAALDRLAWYNDPDSYDLRAELARVHSVSMDHVIVGSGIDDLLGLITHTFISLGDKAVTSLGGYPTFNYFIATSGGQLLTVPYRDDRNDLNALLDTAAASGARLLYLANPDNPSGTWHNARDVEDLVANLPPEMLLLLDQAYAEFAPAEAIPVLDAGNPQLIRLRTFSKVHGMAGARIGYAITSPELVTAFNKIRVQFAVNRVAQAGALASLQDHEFVRNVVNEVAIGREDYAKLARELQLATLPSATNFVAIDMGGFERARATVQALLARDVFVRMPGAPPLNRCIRVTVGLPDERALFEAALREVVASEL